MKNDIKIMIGAIMLTFVLIAGLSWWQNGKQDPAIASVIDENVVSVSPENIELGEVPLEGGIVTREYELQNNSVEKITLKKIATSCMCTEAKIALGGTETKFFGMEHPGDVNPPLSFEISPGEKAVVTVNFDPAAHGPQGTGPFERIVWLTFSDPAGVKHLTFNGNVVNK